MTIRFLCPRGHKLAVPDNLAGKKGRCPICQQRVYIPVPEAADMASAPPDAAGQPEPAPAGVPDEAMADPQRQSPESPAYAAPPMASPLGPLQEAAPEYPPVARPAETTAGPTEGRLGPPPVPPMGQVGGENGFRVESSAVPPVPPGDLAGPLCHSERSEGSRDAPEILRSAQNDSPQELSVIIDEPEEGYQADPGKVQTTYMLAMALGALTLLCAAPALRHPNLVEAPNWARVVLVASALQLVFICWMVSLPDWSTVWICMVVFAFVAALYGVAWAVITFTPDYMPVNFLDLDEPPDAPVRNRAGPWCFVMLMLATLLTYACGRFSGRWRKQYEMAKAMRE